MTPKLGSALEALKKLRSFAEDEGDKLARRINEEAAPMLTAAFRDAHAAVDKLHDGVREITDFVEEINKVGHNGGDPLEESATQSAPRSSEVASR